MPKSDYPVITTSANDALIQKIEWVDILHAGVSHYLKIQAGENAKLGDINFYDVNNDSAIFNNKCAQYGIVPSKSTILVEFIYDIYSDPTVTQREVKIFPENGPYYSIPNKPKAIAVGAVNKTTNTTSQTGGEAL